MNAEVTPGDAEMADDSEELWILPDEEVPPLPPPVTVETTNHNQHVSFTSCPVYASRNLGVDINHGKRNAGD